MSNTPTYDQLSALCAQLAVALEEMCDARNSAERFRARSNATAALTAFRTLSPDPVYTEAKAMRDWMRHAIPLLSGHFYNAEAEGGLAILNRARGEG